MSKETNKKKNSMILDSTTLDDIKGQDSTVDNKKKVQTYIIDDLKTTLSTTNKKLLQSEEKLKLAVEENKKLQEEHLNEMQNKDKAVTTITSTNKKLMIVLEGLRKEVDSKLEKVSFKTVTEKIKNSKIDPNTQADMQFKVREKELKNAYALIDILKRDNKKFEGMDYKSDYYNQYIETLDKLKVEEKKCVDLNTELKLQLKYLDDHKKCGEKLKDFEKERKNLRDEILKHKEKTKELKKTLVTDEQKRTLQLENKANRSLTPKLKKFVNKSEQLEKNEKNKEETKNIATESDEPSRIIKDKKAMRSSTVNTNNLNIYSRKKKNDDFFPAEIKTKLEKVLEKAEIDKLEKKYDFVEQYRLQQESKFKTEIKTLQKKVAELEEQLEFITIQHKEAEQKNKILQYQFHEQKTENKMNTKKIHECHQTIESYSKLLREKDQEIRVSLGQLNALKKISKHNILAPLTDSKNYKLDISESFISPQNDIEDIDKTDIKLDIKNSPKTKSKRSKSPKSPHMNENSVIERSDMSNVDENEDINSKPTLDENYQIKPQNNKGIDDD